MDTNSTYMLTLESLSIAPSDVYPAFIFGTLTYCFIVFCNMTVLATIALDRKLHKPMSISYPTCFIQALLIHLYGVGSFTILTAMAYDRYIAICCPLRYNNIMSQNNLKKIIIVMWLLIISLVVVLLSLVTRFKICRTTIVDLNCNNPSLVKLICDDTRINNYYGLFVTAFVQGMSLIVVIFTYIQILFACVMNKSSDAKRKAIQTCGTHLVVFLFLEYNSCFSLLAHRLEQASPSLRRAFGLSILVFPPILNPLLYGLKTKEIRQNVLRFYKKRCVQVNDNFMCKYNTWILMCVHVRDQTFLNESSQEPSTSIFNVHP
uniref:Olfactory receptor n=1 Tax=Esox lucius TaxID=8010 RepID=A0AAY5K9V3_ESOLU